LFGTLYWGSVKESTNRKSKPNMQTNVPNKRREGCRCRGGEKGELAPTGTVTNYNTIGTCEKK